MGREPIRVLIVDDHDVVREGVAVLLEAVSDVRVVGKVDSASGVLEAAGRLSPEVVLMDVRLGDSSGIAMARELRAAYPDTKVLMFTAYDEDQALFASMMAGAAGFVLKKISAQELASAIHSVAEGNMVIDPSMTARVFEFLRTGAPDAKAQRAMRLSPQEQRILALIAEGLTNRQIGERLGLAEKTVKNYVSKILDKLEISRRTQAVAYVASQRFQGGGGGSEISG